MPQGRQETQSVWVPLGGSSRRYVNRLTGETISRRQYDKLYGTLSRQGYSSYEAKAKVEKQRNPERAARRPARGRKAVYVVYTPDEFETAWRRVIASRRGTGHVYVLIADDPHWQEKLIGKVSRPNIIVDFPVRFYGVDFDRSVVTPFFRFLAEWGSRHYRQVLQYRGKPGDRVGVWVGYEIQTLVGDTKEVIATPVREQPLSVLTGGPFAIDQHIAEFFADMDSVDPIVLGVMLRVLVRR